MYPFESRTYGANGQLQKVTRKLAHLSFTRHLAVRQSAAKAMLESHIAIPEVPEKDEEPSAWDSFNLPG